MTRRHFLATVSATAFALVAGLPGLFATDALADALADIEARGTIRIGVDLGSPPYGFTDGSMQPTGSDVESARLIAEALGVEAELVQLTSPNRVPSLLTGQTDIVMASFSVNAERRQVIDFTDAYGVIPVLVAAPVEMEIESGEDLTGLQVGTTRGTTNDLEATAQFPDAQLVRYDDDATLVTALVSGQVEIMVSSPGIMAAANQRRSGSPLEPKFIARTNPYAIGLRQGEDALRGRLNEVIAEKLDSGELREIFQRYQGVELPETLPET